MREIIDDFYPVDFRDNFLATLDAVETTQSLERNFYRDPGMACGDDRGTRVQCVELALL